MSVKGGCIEGLDWSNVKHIWCKRASKTLALLNFFCLGVYDTVGRGKRMGK